MRKRSRIVVAPVFFATLASVAQAEQPIGWRGPTVLELSASGDKWRDASPTKYQSVQGDFTGHGMRDEAVLLVSSSGKEFAVFLHRWDGSWKMLTRSPIEALQGMGLFALAPGVYKTACGKGYWKCKKGEPKEISLSNEAVLFFADESGSSAFVWSTVHKRFEQIWLSD